MGSNQVHPSCRCFFYVLSPVLCTHILEKKIYIYTYIYSIFGVLHTHAKQVSTITSAKSKRKTQTRTTKTNTTAAAAAATTDGEPQNTRKTPSSQSVRQAISLSSLTWASHVGKNGETNEIPMTRFQWVHLKDTFIPASSFSDASTTRPTNAHGGRIKDQNETQNHRIEKK